MVLQDAMSWMALMRMEFNQRKPSSSARARSSMACLVYGQVEGMVLQFIFSQQIKLL
jgi:hypothetical protein